MSEFSKNNDFFSSINPDVTAKEQAPELVEKYSPKKIESLMPGDIVHPYFHKIGIEATTGHFYVDSSLSLDTSDIDPSAYYGSRAGLMRVYQSTGETTPPIDGFIADIRSAKPGDITEFKYDPMYDDAPHLNRILGYVYTDVEGNVAFRGDARLVDSAQYLAETVNELKGETSSEQDDEEVQELVRKAEAAIAQRELEDDFRGPNYSM